MTSLYAIPENCRLLLLTVALLAVILRAVCYKLATFLYSDQIVGRRIATLEALLLIWTFLNDQLLANAHMGVREALINSLHWQLLRNLVFTLIALFCIAKVLRGGSYKLLLTLGFCALTTPWAEAHLTHFALYYLMSLAFFTILGIYQLWFYQNHLKTNPSRLSVKQAIDNLDSGVLFTKGDGQIVLINTAMQRIVAQITGKLYWPAEVIDIDKQLTLPQNLYRDQSSGKVIQLKRSTLNFDNGDYYQITAADVTEQFAINDSLQQKKDALERAAADLAQSTEQLISMLKVRECRQLEITVHNKMSQAISLLLGALRRGGALDKTSITTFVTDLIANFKPLNYRQPLAEEMQELANAFNLLGVNINYNRLPERGATLYSLYVEIVQEAVSNAVRHGFATTVNVAYRNDGAVEQLTIDDDGSAAGATINYGTGLLAMREKVVKCGGVMVVRAQPKFCIKISCPAPLRRGSHD